MKAMLCREGNQQTLRSILGLILTVKDSLMINVIMLVHPVAEIRARQSGA